MARLSPEAAARLRALATAQPATAHLKIEARYLLALLDEAYPVAGAPTTLAEQLAGSVEIANGDLLAQRDAAEAELAGTVTFMRQLGELLDAKLSQLQRGDVVARLPIARAS